LPTEVSHIVECIVDPFAAVGFHRSHKLRQGDGGSDYSGDMKMIANAVYPQRDSFVIADNARDVFADSIEPIGA
jgi:hypothetical protein